MPLYIYWVWCNWHVFNVWNSSKSLKFVFIWKWNIVYCSIARLCQIQPTQYLIWVHFVHDSWSRRTQVFHFRPHTHTHRHTRFMTHDLLYICALEPCSLPSAVWTRIFTVWIAVVGSMFGYIELWILGLLGQQNQMLCRKCWAPAEWLGVHRGLMAMYLPNIVWGPNLCLLCCAGLMRLYPGSRSNLPRSQSVDKLVLGTWALTHLHMVTILSRACNAECRVCCSFGFLLIS